jgi:homocysteine S-methyltransferase
LTSRPVPSALLGRRAFVTDGGIETDLIHRRGATLPDFAAFPLPDTTDGREMLRSYYDDYAAIARASGRAMMLESPTWRANPDWGHRLGYSAQDLERVNMAAIAFMADLRRSHLDAVGGILISGTIGPRYDGYSPRTNLDPDDALVYHQPQLAAFAAAHADLATAYTITHVGEAIGIVHAARNVDLPIAVSFTVETDGHLASGTTLAEAIRQVDAAAAPDYFLVNCAHPSHIEAALITPGDWTRRIAGTRANASTASHAELDEAIERGDGDPTEFAAAQRRLTTRLPNLSIMGGCCGTDARHIAALMHTANGGTPT